MDKKSEFFIKVIEVLMGVIVAYITYRVSEPKSSITGLFSIMIGLLSTLVVTTLIESYRQSKEIRKTNLHLANLFEKIAERQQDTSDLVQILRYGVTTFPREQVPDVWIEFLWRIGNRLLATSYINPDEGWDQAYTELALEIQRTKIKVNKADIRRVFIVDSEEEITKLRNTICKQKEAGIKVKYIFKRKVEAKSMLKTWADKLETLDFGLVDSKLVSLVFVDKNRRIKHGKVVFNREGYDRYKRFYDSLFEEAEEIEC